jgi:hypothetical protein
MGTLAASGHLWGALKVSASLRLSLGVLGLLWLNTTLWGWELEDTHVEHGYRTCTYLCCAPDGATWHVLG